MSIPDCLTASVFEWQNQKFDEIMWLSRNTFLTIQGAWPVTRHSMVATALVEFQPAVAPWQRLWLRMLDEQRWCMDIENARWSHHGQLLVIVVSLCFESLLFPSAVISGLIWSSRLLFPERFGSLAAAMNHEDEKTTLSSVPTIVTGKGELSYFRGTKGVALLK